MDTTNGTGLTDSKGLGREFRSHELAIRWDERVFNATCHLCGRNFEAGGGPDLYLAESRHVLCPRCGHKSASRLFDMLQTYRRDSLQYSMLQSMAQHCDRMGMPREDLCAVLDAVNAAICKPPLSADDLQDLSYELNNKPPRPGLAEYVANLHMWFKPLVEEPETEDLPF